MKIVAASRPQHVVGAFLPEVLHMRDACLGRRYDPR
jgi:hypothetical protein